MGGGGDGYASSGHVMVIMVIVGVREGGYAGEMVVVGMLVVVLLMVYPIREGGSPWEDLLAWACLRRKAEGKQREAEVEKRGTERQD
jgi:hypothetical protein